MNKGIEKARISGTIIEQFKAGIFPDDIADSRMINQSTVCSEIRQHIAALEDALREQSALIQAVDPNGRGSIYIKHMDYDEWLERCDKSSSTVTALLDKTK